MPSATPSSQEVATLQTEPAAPLVPDNHMCTDAEPATPMVNQMQADAPETPDLCAV